MGLGFIAGAVRIEADEVRLLSQVNTRTEKNRTVSTNNYGGQFVRTSDQYSGYTFQRGATYTNYSITIQKDDNKSAQVHGEGIWDYISTNLSSVSWVGEALAQPGTSYNTYQSTNSQWNFDCETGTNVWVVDTLPCGSTNTYTNYTAILQGPAWPMKKVKYSITTENGGTESDDHTLTTTVELVTSGPANQSALFRLSSLVIDQSAIDPLTGLPTFQWSGWELAGEQVTAGRVFKVFNNNTTNNVSVTLGSSLANTVTNWTYDDPSAVRVKLTTIEWWNKAATNWVEGDVFVLTNTTVKFRVKASPDDVVWPSTLPVWNCGSAGTQGVVEFSMHFDTVSTSWTNPHVVTVTAGNTLTQTVFVCSYDIKLQSDPAYDFPGKSTNRFGVAEQIHFSADVKPEGVELPLGWHATYSHVWTSTNGADYSRISDVSASGGIFLAGSEAETVTVTATILDGPSFEKSQSKPITIVAPTNIVMLNYAYFGGPTPLVPSTNIWHVENTVSCGKLASYFLKPDDVSFAGIRFKEGYALYLQNGVSTNGVWWHRINEDGTIGNLTWIRIENVHQAWSEFKAIAPGYSFATNFIAANFCCTDQFSIQPRVHLPPVEWTQSINLPLLYRFVSHEYEFATNPQTTIISTNGKVSIRKDGLPSGLTNYFQAEFNATSTTY